MQRPTSAGISTVFLTLIVWALSCLIQVALTLFALLCLLGILTQIADKGGGMINIKDRRRVTVEQRFGACVLYGSLGVLSVIGALRLNRYPRSIALSYSRVGGGEGDGRDGAKPLSPSVRPDLTVSEIWDRELDGSP
jgi:hypothetical protein